MKLYKYYIKAVIYPTLFILLFSLFYALINNFNTDRSTAVSLIVITVLTSALFALTIAVLSLPVFLNKIKKMNQNWFWNAGTWFLLPITYIVITLVHDLGLRIKYNFDYGDDFFYLLFITLPFVTALVWSFILFRKKIRLTGNKQ